MLTFYGSLLQGDEKEAFSICGENLNTNVDTVKKKTHGN